MDLSQLPDLCQHLIFEYLSLPEQLAVIRVWPYLGHQLRCPTKLKLSLYQRPGVLDITQVFGSSWDNLPSLQQITWLLDVMDRLEDVDVGDIGIKFSQKTMVKVVAANPRNIKHLQLGLCCDVTSREFGRMVESLPLLESLEADFDYPVSDVSNMVNELLIKRPGIHTLAVRVCTTLSCDAFVGIANRLKSLTLKDCGKSLTPEFLVHLISSTTTLETLVFPTRMQLSAGIVPSVVQFVNLRVVRLPHGHARDCRIPQNRATTLANLSSLHRLEELDLQWYCIHDEDIYALIAGCGALTSLQMEDCWGSHHVASSTALASLRQLEHLHTVTCGFSGADGRPEALNNFVLTEWSRGLLNLQKLDFVASRITTPTLTCLAKMRGLEQVSCHLDSLQFNEMEETLQILSVSQLGKPTRLTLNVSFKVVLCWNESQFDEWWWRVTDELRHEAFDFNISRSIPPHYW